MKRLAVLLFHGFSFGEGVGGEAHQRMSRGFLINKIGKQAKRLGYYKRI
jgi:hypothetical protein